MQDDVRSGYAFAEAVGSLQEWQLGEGESGIACRVLRIYDYLDGCAPFFRDKNFLTFVLSFLEAENGIKVE